MTELRFYCVLCEISQPVEIEPLEADHLNATPQGDIICDVCHLVIATMSADERGRLVFVNEEQAAGIVAAAPLLAAIERLAAKEEVKTDDT